MLLRGYYFITDSGLSLKNNESDVKNALRAGVKVIQYRDKCASTKKMFEEALRLKSICKNAKFIVNDRLDIALAVDADGIHIGTDDLPYKIARRLLGKKKIIGLTVRNLKEAKEAERLGADYIGVAPIFSTKTKRDAGKPVGVKLLKEIRESVSIPIIAIGGINLRNAKEVIMAGAYGLCAISQVVTKPDVRNQIKKFQALFRQYKYSKRV